MHKTILLFLILSVILASCNLPEISPSPQSGQPGPTFTPFQPQAGQSAAPDAAGGAPDMGGGGVVYPATPEEVVGAFLITLQENPGDLAVYLSSRQLLNLPENGVAGLVGLSGDLEGYAVQSAAVSAEPAGAILNVSIITGGQEQMRQFSLFLENGRWVIDAVQKVDG